MAAFLANLANIGALPFVILSTFIAIGGFLGSDSALQAPAPSHAPFRIAEPAAVSVIAGNEIFVRGVGVPRNHSVVLVVDGPGGRTIQDLGVDVTSAGVFSGRAAIGSISSPAGEYRISAVAAKEPGSSVVASNKIPPDAVWSEAVAVVRK